MTSEIQAAVELAKHAVSYVPDDIKFVNYKPEKQLLLAKALLKLAEENQTLRSKLDRYERALNRIADEAQLGPDDIFYNIATEALAAIESKNTK